MDVATLSEFLPALALAIALAASAGLRAWLPLLLAGGLARAGVLDLGDSFSFLASNKALWTSSAPRSGLRRARCSPRPCSAPSPIP